MNIELPKKLKDFVERKIKAGAYKSEVDLVRDGIERLMLEDFAPSELADLVAVGEEQLTRGDVIAGAKVFKELRALRKRSKNA